MHALIIGGGIAGPVLGAALRYAGIDATVYEAASAEQDGAGAFLQLAPNGVNALKTLGLETALDDADGFHTSGITFANHRGRVIGALESRGEQERYGAANVLVKRGRLHAALRDAASARGVEIVFGRRLAAYRGVADRVHAAFADGTTATGDVLIGCDGIRSQVRQLLLRPGPTPVYTGIMNLGGFAKLHVSEVGRNHMVFGRRAFFGYTAAPSGEVYWFSNIPQREESAPDGPGTPEEWLVHARRMHANDPEPIPEILAAAPPPVGAWPVQDLPSLPSWHNGRVCLAGDAAHAMSPSAGQGASVALEDTVTLAKCLRDHAEPAAAFAAYTQLRKSRAEAIVKQARRNSNHKIPGPVGGLIRDLLLPTFLKLGVKQAADTYSYRISWDEHTRTQVNT
jgi:2-polyprenyl-6-methoxyphenol hydroxylase-like FAD-dependent oxidoreductase